MKKRKSKRTPTKMASQMVGSRQHLQKDFFLYNASKASANPTLICTRHRGLGGPAIPRYNARLLRAMCPSIWRSLSDDIKCGYGCRTLSGKADSHRKPSVRGRSSSSSRTRSSGLDREFPAQCQTCNMKNNSRTFHLPITA
ncbi:uncharacterized protein ACWYII_027645 isoform 1-T1 [Salvelinus alpinus]